MPLSPISGWGRTGNTAPGVMSGRSDRGHKGWHVASLHQASCTGDKGTGQPQGPSPINHIRTQTYSPIDLSIS